MDLSFSVIAGYMGVGIIIAMILAYLNKRALGGFVSELLKREAVTPRAAVVFSELQSSHNPLVAMTLNARGTFRRMVYLVCGEMSAEFNETSLALAYARSEEDPADSALSETADLAEGGTLNAVTASGANAVAAPRAEAPDEGGKQEEPSAAERGQAARELADTQRSVKFTSSCSVYIPEHFVKKAQVLYADKTASLFTLSLSVVALLLVLIVLYYAEPAIMNFWSSFGAG